MDNKCRENRCGYQAALELRNHDSAERREIFDVTSEYETAQRLLNLFCSNNVYPCHLCDIAEDFLADRNSISDRFITDILSAGQFIYSSDKPLHIFTRTASSASSRPNVFSAFHPTHNAKASRLFCREALLVISY